MGISQEREVKMGKYTEEEWLEILLGAADLERALAEVCDLEPDRAKLLQKLTVIADPEQEDVNARIWESLMVHIRVSFGDKLFGSADGAALEKALPDSAFSLDPIACRRLAGRLQGAAVAPPAAD
jgi:hypothetical protein